MSSATIIGLDTPAGAYLARLLRARGYRVAGSATDLSAATAMLAAVGADEVTLLPDPFAGPAGAEVYLLDGMVTLAAALAAAPGARVLTTAAASVPAGRFAVVATLGDHASRLDPPDSPVLATCRAVRDRRPLPAADPAAHDLGWTPEYVDALWRMLQADAPADAAIRSGEALGQRDIARHAAEYFKVPVDLPPEGSAVATTASGPPGWRAFTTGRELVRALCEGLPAA